MNTPRPQHLRLKEVGIEDDYLKATFLDGKSGRVSLSALTPEDRENVDWAHARVTRHGVMIIAPADPMDLHISWQVVRSLIDQDFAKFLAERAEEQARYIGERLRELREHRGLTQKQVAQRAGLEPANLSRIENGHVDVSSSTLWKLLAVMGCSPSDLARETAGQIAAD